MFRSVEGSTSFPKLEERIIAFWRDRKIYEKSLASREAAPPFVFFEGPPTANGLPHPGHCLTRAIKDLFPRYKTMRGYRCERKAGWDTHGLPVEVEVCKDLGIHAKEEIEAYGVEPFIHLCRESVFRYMKQWEELTERIGFWIHLDEAYVTYHQSYVESVWWALKTLFDRGLLYQGHKIVWWWAQGGTALSSGEVGQGYREVADPSVYVRFPLVPGQGSEWDGVDLLVWTTTPWTLPSNQFAAVRGDLDYAVVEVCDENGNAQDRRLVLATALVETIAAKVKKDLRVVRTFKGEQLLGLRYLPPFGGYYEQGADPAKNIAPLGERQGTLKDGGSQHVNWRVVEADFVTTDSGTGVVHQAPAFGEVDFEVLMAEQARFVAGQGPELICAVAPDGKFYSKDHGGESYRAVPEIVRGLWVKDADKILARDLRDRGLLFHLDQYLHDYPFCWRAEEDPLIQYPRKSWFIRTTRFRDQMLANNQKINWLPEHIRDGRFGNFLESNVDWALSRERYWGTPLPIWVCEKTGHMEAIGSYAELLAKPGVDGVDVWEKAKAADPELVDDLKVHKPYIDAVTYDSPKAPGARMRRVSEVIDCWFDSGAMPFAQWGYPHLPGSAERFTSQFPADFISEAIDQTRGWFYSQLAISTLLFGDAPPAAATDAPAAADNTISHPYPHPFKNCIVLGLMLGEDGQKMSKSKRNYREPREIFDRYGADALRWYFFANQAPWTSIRYSEQAIKETIPEFLLRLWNVYSFFVIYANIDGFDPATEITGPIGQLTGDVLDRAATCRPRHLRSELDLWIHNELQSTCGAVCHAMDEFDNFSACQRITEFVDALSNWYVRRSRDRFWSGDKRSVDKRDAYWTLYECLVTLSKLIAPFVPFLAEELWQNLAVTVFADREASDRPVESVHLCDYPQGSHVCPISVGDIGGEASAVEQLSRQMALVREIVSLGRAARMEAKLKVRQPLARVEVVLADAAHREWLERHTGLIEEELNVKRVEFPAKADEYITYTVLPDLKRLGPKLGKRLPAVKKALAEANGGKLLSELNATGKVILQLPDGPVELIAEEIQVRLQAKDGWAAAQGRSSVVVLATELTAELIAEGYARELVRMVQDRRKELGCEYTDRITIGVLTDSEEVLAALRAHPTYIAGETLAARIEYGPLPGAEGVASSLAGAPLTLYVNVRK